MASLKPIVFICHTMPSLPFVSFIVRASMCHRRTYALQAMFPDVHFALGGLLHPSGLVRELIARSETALFLAPRTRRTACTAGACDGTQAPMTSGCAGSATLRPSSPCRTCSRSSAQTTAMCGHSGMFVPDPCQHAVRMLVELNARSNMRFMKFEASDWLEHSAAHSSHTHTFTLRPAFMGGKAMSPSMLDTLLYQACADAGTQR